MHRLHEQRIALAVAAALEGRTIAFAVDGGAAHGNGMASYIFWRGPIRHVIASGSRRGMEALLPNVQAEFARQLHEAARAKTAELLHERRPDAAH